MDPCSIILYGCREWGSSYVMSLRLMKVSRTHSKLLKKRLVLLAHIYRSVVKNKFSIIISALGALYTAERKCNYVTQVIFFNFFKLKYASLHSEVMLHDTPLRMYSLHRTTLILNILKKMFERGSIIYNFLKTLTSLTVYVYHAWWEKNNDTDAGQNQDPEPVILVYPWCFKLVFGEL